MKLVPNGKSIPLIPKPPPTQYATRKKTPKPSEIKLRVSCKPSFSRKTNPHNKNLYQKTIIQPQKKAQPKTLTHEKPSNLNIESIDTWVRHQNLKDQIKTIGEELAIALSWDSSKRKKLISSAIIKNCRQQNQLCAQHNHLFYKSMTFATACASILNDNEFAAINEFTQLACSTYTYTHTEKGGFHCYCPAGMLSIQMLFELACISSEQKCLDLKRGFETLLQDIEKRVHTGFFEEHALEKTIATDLLSNIKKINIKNPPNAVL